MIRSTTRQWVFAFLWILLIIGALLALLTDNNALFRIVAVVGVALGTTMSALQIRRRRDSQG